MSVGPFTGPVQRPSDGRDLAELFGRVEALERVRPGTGTLYVDDRILDAAVQTVTFDTFPSDLHILELTWDIALDDASTVDLSMLFANFDDTFELPTEDYFWRLAGTVALDDSDNADGGAGLGLLQRDGGNGWGRARFPNYNAADWPGDGRGPMWVGDGAIATENGDETDQWIAAGYRQGTDPLTSIELSSWTLDGADQQTFAAGSRFTLVGY